MIGSQPDDGGNPDKRRNHRYGRDAGRSLNDAQSSFWWRILSPFLRWRGAIILHADHPNRR